MDDDSTWTLAPFAYDTASYLAKWKSLPDKDKVKVRGYKSFDVNFGSSTFGGLSELYGCTALFLVSRKRFVIGHYPGDVGESCPLKYESMTRNLIIKGWLETTDFSLDALSPNGNPECDDVFVMIAGLAEPRGTGVPVLIDYLVETELIPRENIRYHKYSRSQGGVEDQSLASASGAAFVEWTSTDENSAAVGVYVGSVSPRLWMEFRKGSDGTFQHAVSWGYAVPP